MSQTLVVDFGDFECDWHDFIFSKVCSAFQFKFNTNIEIAHHHHLQCEGIFMIITVPIRFSEYS